MKQCSWCKKDIKYHGATMCDSCWELDHRIRLDLNLAMRMVAYYVAEDLRKSKAPVQGGTNEQNS